MKEESIEKLGELKDRIDNLIAGLNIPMGDSFHLGQLKRILPELSKDVKDIYIEEVGDDIWV